MAAPDAQLRAAVESALGEVRARIEAAGRSPDDVQIVAVTKGFGPDAVVAALGAGLATVGENYAQELLTKASVAPEGVRWHFLGPVQRNKVKALHPHVALWHGVDREAAGREIIKHAPAAPVLVQVNLSGDPARPGVSWGDAPALVDALRTIGLDVRGLMGVAGLDGARQQFSRLARLARDVEVEGLSMGMSGDFEIAVSEGATIVRIGTALFGARPGATQVRR